MKEYINQKSQKVIISEMSDIYLQNAINYFKRRLDEIEEYLDSGDVDLDPYWPLDVDEARDAAKDLLKALRSEKRKRKL